MKNKVLVNVYAPNLDESYEIYIPVNESVYKVLQLVLKMIYELSDSNFDMDKKHYLCDPDTLTIYEPWFIVRDTNISNDKKIILI